MTFTTGPLPRDSVNILPWLSFGFFFPPLRVVFPTDPIAIETPASFR